MFTPSEMAYCFGDLQRLLWSAGGGGEPHRRPLRMWLQVLAQPFYLLDEEVNVRLRGGWV